MSKSHLLLAHHNADQLLQLLHAIFVSLGDRSSIDASCPSFTRPSPRTVLTPSIISTHALLRLVYDMHHHYIFVFVFVRLRIRISTCILSYSTLYTGNKEIVMNVKKRKDGRSEKGRTAAPSGAGKFPLVHGWIKPFETLTRAHCISFALFLLSFVIRSDPPPPIPPCQRTKLDFRPAQYNSNLWMDKGPLSNSCSKERVRFANL